MDLLQPKVSFLDGKMRRWERNGEKEETGERGRKMKGRGIEENGCLSLFFQNHEFLENHFSFNEIYF